MQRLQACHRHLLAAARAPEYQLVLDDIGHLNVLANPLVVVPTARPPDYRVSGAGCRVQGPKATRGSR
jgi:hypothetical protein